MSSDPTIRRQRALARARSAWPRLLQELDQAHATCDEVLAAMRQLRAGDVLDGLPVADVRGDLAALAYQFDFFRHLLEGATPPSLLPDAMLPVPRHLVGAGAEHHAT